MLRHLLFASLLLLPAAAQAARLTIDAGKLPASGNLVIAVFGDEESWSSNRKPVATARLPVPASGPAEVVLDLPTGHYAIMAFHDSNADDKLNTSFIGKPTERYGFSNDARGLFGAPKWKAASFRLEADTVMALRLR